VGAAVVLGRHLDVVVFPPAVGFLVLNAEVREIKLVVEVRQVVFQRPLADFSRGAIRVAVVVVALAIPLVQPLLVVTLELVVENDVIDTRAALVKTLGLTFVRR
jgi:hypothetical protein